MAPSQLKQLKNSLREHGLTGPPQSKKQKKRGTKDQEKRLQRNAALHNIRERFNPFEFKASARSTKFEVTTNKPVNGVAAKGLQGRPGVTKGLGEERRRATLLKEIHSRNKVGGILDRRFGENDPTLTPEERAVERYARESQRKLNKSSMFNLEDDEEEIQLTHMGRSLAFDGDKPKEDFTENDVEALGSDDDLADDEHRSRKRRRLSDPEDVETEADAEGGEVEEPERRKTKNEVMKEVIAKSKLHKYERQQAKEDDDDLRAELDKGLPDFYALLRNQKKAPPPPAPEKTDQTAIMDPGRLALLQGKDREEADREYNVLVREMALDKRSKPGDRTKTDEEKAQEEAERSRMLEEKRLRRMKGLQEDSSEDEDVAAPEHPDDEERDPDDAEAFGLGQLPNGTLDAGELGVEDEDDFELDDNLIANDSEAELSEGTSNEEEREESDAEDDGDDELINGLHLPKESERTGANSMSLGSTYSCPSTHTEFLEITKDVKIEELPTIIQRIRAIYHPKLNSTNKSKLEIFSKILTEHLVYLANQPSHPPFSVLETIIRHLHSLAKTFPEAIGSAFRYQLKDFSDTRPLTPMPGDLMILTAISTIFPTSDHFHAVVTPANLIMARYLSQSSIQSLSDLAIGAYICTLCLDYQRLSKRYMPEAMNSILNSLMVLAPVPAKSAFGFVPFRPSPPGLRISQKAHSKPMLFWDAFEEPSSAADSERRKQPLLNTYLVLLSAAADLWSGKSAFPEIISPALGVLTHLLTKSNTANLASSTTANLKAKHSHLTTLSNQAILSRRSLLLHNHRPLAIKTSIPKFEESFNPDKHYDPDRERADMSKLKAEHKREQKGALRELRKDASFIAREGLREKKEKDAAYDKKFKRLVAEIQGEEGREGNEYEREKKKRKTKR